MSISTRQASLQELANIVDASVHGDPEVVVSGIATLELAKSSELSFFSNRKYHKHLLKTQASIVILHPDDVDSCPTNAILSNDPYLAYAKIATWLTKPEIQQNQIASSAVISDSATIGVNVSIGANVVIGENSIIGDNVTLAAGCIIEDRVKVGHETICYANVSIYSNVIIGERSIIHSGAVIGSDGFGIANEK